MVEKIEVDQGDYLPPAQQTGGQLYTEDPREVAALAAPPLCCPNCSKVVLRIGSATAEYPLPAKVADNVFLGINRRLLTNRFSYAADPCGCKLSQEWASAWSAELNSRLQGNTPRFLLALTEIERQDKIAVLEGVISTLMTRQTENTGDAKFQQAVECYLVMATDQLMRLCPGEHNRMPAKLSQEVKDWAAKLGLPANGPVLPSSYVAYGVDYQMPGTYSKSLHFAALGKYPSDVVKHLAGKAFPDQPAPGGHFDDGVAHGGTPGASTATIAAMIHKHELIAGYYVPGAVSEQTPAPAYQKEWLRLVHAAFTNEFRGLMLSMVSQVAGVPAAGPELLELASQTAQAIEAFLDRGVPLPFSVKTFLSDFYDKSGVLQSVAGPVPAPAQPVPQVDQLERSCQKARRKIRRVLP